MKVKSFEVITGQMFTAMGTLLLYKGEEILAGIIALIVAYLLTTGFIVKMLDYGDEELEGGLENDSQYKDRRLPVTYRKHA